MTARDLIARAESARREGRVRAAADLYRQAAGAARMEGDPGLVSHALRHQGEILSIAGDVDSAETPLAEALDIIRRLSGVSPLDLANTVRPLGILRARIGHASARGLLAEARDLYAQAGIGEGVSEMERRLEGLA